MPVSRRSIALRTPLAALALAACGPPPENLGALRLGYFPNLTHALALIGIERGFFQQELERAGVGLETFSFHAGPAAIESLLSGALDATYVGPGPAINAFVKSRGEAVRVIAGAAIGGASFVVRPEISSPADLRGKTLATPQLGGTQDVALRTWLHAQGLSADEFGGGDVSVSPQDNAQTLERMRAGSLAGAWVPEPWASRLVLEGGGKVLVDERTLWPEGRFVTTLLLVRKAQLDVRPDVITALLRGHLAAERWLVGAEDDARSLVNTAIARLTGKALAPGVIERAWNNLRFTSDPLQSALLHSARDAEALRFIRPGDLDLTQIFALQPLAALQPS